MSEDTALLIAGIGVALAVPLTFMFANYIRKNVDYGEAQFGSDGKVKPDPANKPTKDAQPASRKEDG